MKPCFFSRITTWKPQVKGRTTSKFVCKTVFWISRQTAVTVNCLIWCAPSSHWLLQLIPPAVVSPVQKQEAREAPQTATFNCFCHSSSLPVKRFCTCHVTWHGSSHTISLKRLHKSSFFSSWQDTALKLVSIVFIIIMLKIKSLIFSSCSFCKET